MHFVTYFAFQLIDRNRNARRSMLRSFFYRLSHFSFLLSLVLKVILRIKKHGLETEIRKKNTIRNNNSNMIIIVIIISYIVNVHDGTTKNEDHSLT